MFCIQKGHKWDHYATQKDHKFTDFDKNDGVMCIVIHTFLVILVKICVLRVFQIFQNSKVKF